VPPSSALSAETTPSTASTRIGYLIAEYPKISHTFIDREIEALRELGVDVATFSIRPTPADQLLTEADRRAAAETFSILPAGPGRLARAHLRGLRAHPLRYATTLVQALRLSAGGARANLWQLFYFAEAMVLWEECRRRGIDHIHAHFANVASAVAMFAASFGGGDRMSWSFTMHGPTEFDDVTRYAIAEKIRSATFVACISDYCRAQLMKLVEPRHWDKLSVVRCGLDFDQLPDLDLDLDVGLDLDEAGAGVDTDGRASGPLRVLSVGRLVADKGQLLLVQAVAALRARGVDVTLTLVGDGPDRGALTDAVRRLGIGESVLLAGAVDQGRLPELYLSSDVFCMPSFAEGLPVVLMEAMAHGLPVVATRIAGVSELVQDGVNGAVVAAGRVDLIVDALARLAADPELRARWGAAGRHGVRDDHDIRASALTLAELFGIPASLTIPSEHGGVPVSA
jgi:colanic acid/amylovoran biosynthesis glycosyltransferase